MCVFKGDNELTEVLLKRLNKTGKIHMVPASIKGKYIIRFTVTSQYTTDADIERDWKIISDMATRLQRDDVFIEEEEDDVFCENAENDVTAQPLRVARIPSIKRKEYGMSLLLSNVPMSPKLINGSFAALFDNNDVIVEFAKDITNSDFNGRPIRLSPRRRLKLSDQNRQKSLDTDLLTHRALLNRFKQSSLDSKVDEILELSEHENGQESETDDANGVQFEIMIDVVKPDANEENVEDDFEDEINVGALILDKPQKKTNSLGVNDNNINGNRVCSHCGHILEEF